VDLLEEFEKQNPENLVQTLIPPIHPQLITWLKLVVIENVTLCVGYKALGGGQ
jgi:hypothetical protein